MSKPNLIEINGAKLNQKKEFNFCIDNIKSENKEKKNNIFWIDKYTPLKTSDIDSNRSIIIEIKNWLNNFYKKDSNSCCVILGVHGIGKTLIAKLLVKEWELFIAQVLAQIKVRKAGHLLDWLQ